MQIAKKFLTTVDYVAMGICLGNDIGSKCRLSTMLISYKLKLLQRKFSSTIHRVQIKSCHAPIYLRDEDISLINEIFWREDYLFEKMKKRDVFNIIDLGAHIGLFSLWIKSKYPDAIVHCYEPDPENFELLQKNVKQLDGIVLNIEAVGGFPGEAKFYVDSTRHALSSLKESNVKRAVLRNVKTLDDIIDEAGGADLIKFDIEGLEYEVFSRSLKAQNVHQIVGEVHGKSSHVKDFLDLFPNHVKHVKRFSSDMYIVYLHRQMFPSC